jgi:hypothetical protein
MECNFIFIRNYTKKTYVIYWVNAGLTHNALRLKYKIDNPKDNITVMGGGKLHMELDKKQVTLFGTTCEFGQFNLELVNHWAKHQFPNWTIVCNSWADSYSDAIAGWTKCNFKYQLFHEVYDKAEYAAILKSGEELLQIYPTNQQFIVLTPSENYQVGSFVNPEDIHEIRRTSHKRSKNLA